MVNILFIFYMCMLVRLLNVMCMFVRLLNVMCMFVRLLNVMCMIVRLLNVMCMIVRLLNVMCMIVRLLNVMLLNMKLLKSSIESQKTKWMLYMMGKLLPVKTWCRCGMWANTFFLSLLPDQSSIINVYQMMKHK